MTANEMTLVLQLRLFTLGLGAWCLIVWLLGRKGR